MRGKKIGIIIIIILIVLILAGIFTYLFMATNIFKSKQQLFYEYTAKAIEQIEQMADSKTLENYKKEMNNNNFETNTTYIFNSKLEKTIEIQNATINIKDGKIIISNEEVCYMLDNNGNIIEDN